MEALKTKLHALKNNTEAAEEREKEAIEQFREVELEVDAKTEEKESIKRRIQLLSRELVRIEEQYAEAKQKLDDFAMKTSENEEARKLLEEEDRVTDETLAEMEEKTAQARAFASEQENVLAETQRKFVVVERDLQLADNRLEANEKRAKALEADIEQGGENLRELEGKDAKCAERDEVHEEKIRFLEQQLSETVKRYEDAEMLVLTREREKEQVECDIDTVLERIERFKTEMDDIADLGND